MTVSERTLRSVVACPWRAPWPKPSYHRPDVRMRNVVGADSVCGSGRICGQFGCPANRKGQRSGNTRNYLQKDDFVKVSRRVGDWVLSCTVLRSHDVTSRSSPSNPIGAFLGRLFITVSWLPCTACSGPVPHRKFPRSAFRSAFVCPPAASRRHWAAQRPCGHVAAPNSGQREVSKGEQIVRTRNLALCETRM
jgi:hypothetical protein